MIEFAIIVLCLAVGVSGSSVFVWVVPLVIVCLLYVITKSVRGIVAGVILAAVFITGTWYASIRSETLAYTALGNRTLTASVVSVDRQLDQTVIVAKTGTGARVQAYVSVKTILPGDVIMLTGTLTEPKDFLTDTGRTFGYREYMYSRGITDVMYRADVRIVEIGTWSLVRTATIIRFAIADIFARYLPFPNDGIVAGMLVGYRGGIPENINDLFRDTGVLHVLVLSGYNITLFASFLFILLKRLPYRARLAGTAVLIGLLVLVSGAGVASVRAGVMGAIGVLAGLTLRTYRPVRALAVVILIFFILSPHSIVFDPGFHLSVIATFCMVAVVPKIVHLFRFIPRTKHIDIRELCSLALILPVFMLPYTMYFSGLAPLAALPANILLGAIASVVMVGGFILLSTSWIPPLASVIGSCMSTVLDMTISLIQIFAKLPVWNTPPISGWGVVGIYAGIVGYLFRAELNAIVSQLRNSLGPRSSSSVRENR